MTEYQTNDMWLAAFLMCVDFKFQRLLGGNRKRKTFVLKGDSSKLLESSRAYYQGTARVDPKALRHHLTDLKGYMSSRAVTTPQGKKGGSSGASSNEDNTSE